MNPNDIKLRIEQNLQITGVECIDTTGGGNHFQLKVPAANFKELSRVARHQKIMSVFDAELKTGELHALSIQFY